MRSSATTAFILQNAPQTVKPRLSALQWFADSDACT
jgi:hypothetical protein